MTRPRPITLLILTLFLISSLSLSAIRQAHAQPIGSSNMIVNPGFEQPLSSGWVADIYDDGTYGDTITVNSTIHHSGTYAARLDISNNYTSIKLNTTTTNSHIELIQYPTTPPMFSNFTDRPDGLNMYYYVQPKYSGATAFEVRFRSGNIYEMDYVSYNPNPVLGYQGGFVNSTTGSEGGKPLKIIILPPLQPNQWNLLSRNVRRDWQAPLKLPNGTLAPGFPLNDTLSRFEVNAYLNRDPNTNNVYAETVWVDDISLYVGNTISLPAFTYQDWTGNSVDSIVTSRLYNITTGAPVTLSPGSLIPSNTVVVKAYYHSHQIYSDPITPLTPSTITLAIIATDSSRSGYIAINSTTTRLAIVENTMSQILFNATGTQPSLIIADIPTQPITIVQDGTNTPTWSYNSTSQILLITTIGLGQISISFKPVIPLPQITFQDITGTAIGNAVSWKLVNTQGQQVQLPTGTLVPIGAYTLTATYGGYLIYGATVDQNLQAPIHLSMIPLGGSTTNYVAFNSTISQVNISENSKNRISFTSTGKGPSLIIIKVPAKPVSVQKDGATITTWTYNSTSGTVAIQTATLGAFTVNFTNNGDQTELLITIAVIAAIAIAASAVFLWRKTINRSGEPSSTKSTVKPGKSGLDNYREKP